MDEFSLQSVSILFEKRVSRLKEHLDFHFLAQVTAGDKSCAFAYDSETKKPVHQEIVPKGQIVNQHFYRKYFTKWVCL